MVNTNPTTTQLRWFTAFWLVWIALIGGGAWLRGSHDGAVTVWVAGALVGAFAAASLRFARLLFVGLSYVTYPIGWIVGRALLTLVFFLMITPIGLIRRAFGASPIARTLDRSASTYWVARDADARPSRYFSEF